MPRFPQVAEQRLQDSLARGDRIVVSDLVLAESYYALHYHYGVPKAEARELLRAMVSSGAVHLQPESSLWALEGALGAGLVDRLIVTRYQGFGAMTWTFDRRLSKLEGTVRMTSKRQRKAHPPKRA